MKSFQSGVSMSARGKAVPLVSLRRIVMLASRLEIYQRSMVVYLVMLGMPEDEVFKVVFEADGLCNHPFPELIPEYGRAPRRRVWPHVHKTPDYRSTFQRRQRRLTPVGTLFQPQVPLFPSSCAWRMSVVESARLRKMHWVGIDRCRLIEGASI